MKTVKFHPAFICFILIFVLIGKWMEVVFSLFSVLLHEYSHYRVALSRCYYLNRLTLMPYGAVLGGGEKIRPRDDFYISLAGPLANFGAAIILLAGWWLFPSLYNYTYLLWKINLALGLYNLLPFYPLDGARIILSKVKNRVKWLKILRNGGIFASVVFAVIFLYSALGRINYSFALASVFLFIGAVSGTRRDTYVYLCDRLDVLRDYSDILEKRILIAREDVTLRRLLKEQKPFFICEVEVVDSVGKNLHRLNSEDLRNVFERYPMNSKIGDCLPLRKVLSKAEGVSNGNKARAVNSMKR